MVLHLFSPYLRVSVVKTQTKSPLNFALQRALIPVFVLF